MATGGRTSRAWQASIAPPTGVPTQMMQLERAAGTHVAMEGAKIKSGGDVGFVTGPRDNENLQFGLSSITQNTSGFPSFGAYSLEWSEWTSEYFSGHWIGGTLESYTVTNVREV